LAFEEEKSILKHSIFLQFGQFENRIRAFIGRGGGWNRFWQIGEIMFEKV